MIAEYDNAGDFAKRYVHGACLDEVLLEIDDSNDVAYLHHDRVGSIIATTNDTGVVIDTYAYSPWGECGDMSGTTFGFQGQRFDHETGLYFMKARHYDPKIGRFLQPDPIGYGDGLNMYQFGYNNPNSFSDPLGLGGADGSQGSSDTGSGANSSGNSGSVDYDHVLMGDPNFGDHTHIDGTIPDTEPPTGSPDPNKPKFTEAYWVLYRTPVAIDVGIGQLPTYHAGVLGLRDNGTAVLLNYWPTSETEIRGQVVDGTMAVVNAAMADSVLFGKYHLSGVRSNAIQTSGKSIDDFMSALLRIVQNHSLKSLPYQFDGRTAPSSNSYMGQNVRQAGGLTPALPFIGGKFVPFINVAWSPRHDPFPT